MIKELEIELKDKLKVTLDLIYSKLNIKPIKVTFKYMEEKSILEKGIINISKEYLDNYFMCLHLAIKELNNHYNNLLNKTVQGINYLDILTKTFLIISKAKIITPKIKEELIGLGFKEVMIGCKEIHELNSKDIKLDSYGYDIVIGLAARSISYGCGRLYRGMSITL